jgi:hypothetical protein
MRSQFEKFSEKNLKLILRVISEVIYERDLINYSNRKNIKSKLDDLGFQISSKDYEFLFELFRLNPNFETEKIQLPLLHNYEVTFQRSVVKYSVEYWERDVESYLTNDNDLKGFIDEFDDVEWWEGKLVDEDPGDEETTDLSIYDINRID